MSSSTLYLPLWLRHRNCIDVVRGETARSEQDVFELQTHGRQRKKVYLTTNTNAVGHSPPPPIWPEECDKQCKLSDSIKQSMELFLPIKHLWMIGQLIKQSIVEPISQLTFLRKNFFFSESIFNSLMKNFWFWKSFDWFFCTKFSISRCILRSESSGGGRPGSVMRSAYVPWVVSRVNCPLMKLVTEYDEEKQLNITQNQHNRIFNIPNHIPPSQRRGGGGARVKKFDHNNDIAFSSCRYTGRLLSTDSTLKCCCRDWTGLIWTRNVSFYAEFSQNLDWKILVWKFLITATPWVRDWKWQILTRHVWPQCFPKVFPRYFIRVWLNSKTKIFQKQKG